MKKHSYTVLLSASLVVVLVAWLGGYLSFMEYIMKTSPMHQDVVVEHMVSPEELLSSLMQEEGSEGGVLPEEETLPVPAPETGQEEVVKDFTSGTPVFFEADRSYWDDALFIGDSRTVGLADYGNLGNAAVFAETGMSIYKLFATELPDAEGNKVSLEQMLQEHPYGKIYLMLGINELGYRFEATQTKYQEIVARIRELQPNAILFLQANLHVSKKKSNSMSNGGNEKLIQLNGIIQEMANGVDSFYLDVNPLFDDEEGYLSSDFTGDGAHIQAKYYENWTQFLLCNAVRYE